MIELRDCIVGVKDEKEYEKVIQIAKAPALLMIIHVTSSLGIVQVDGVYMLL